MSEQFDFFEWFLAQLDEAPDLIRMASGSFTQEGPAAEAGELGDLPGFYAETFDEWARLIVALEKEAPDWVGTGWACLAYFRKQAGDYSEAVECAQRARQAGLTPMGAWYGYDAWVTALDELDDWQAAMSKATEAAEYLTQAALPVLASDFHLRHANLCHRAAGHNGRGPTGKQYMVQAVEGICQCIAVAPDDCKETVLRELTAIGKNRKAFGIEPDAYPQLLQMPEIRSIVEPHLGWPTRQAVTAARAKLHLRTGAATAKQQAQTAVSAATAAGTRAVAAVRDQDLSPAAVKQTFLGATDGLATLMDSRYRIPFTSVRFGWDPVLGIVPVVGDAIAMFITCGIIVRCVDYKPPKRLYARMALNTAVDFVFGSIPVAGTVFDVVYRSNKKNIGLMQQFIEASEAAQADAGTHPEGGEA